MPKVNVDDIELYYEVHGEGTPLLMITGFGGNLDGWDSLVPRVKTLSKHFQVITLDNRGTGRSSHPDGPYSIKTMADDVSSLLDYLSIEKTHVLGVSMGGKIAQELAINHPEKVNRIVLVCTTPGGSLKSDPKQKEATEKLSWRFSPPIDMTPSDIQSELFEIVYYPDYFHANKERIMSNIPKIPTVLSTLKKQYEAILEHDTENRIQSISAKTLIIHGEDDHLLFPNGAILLAEKIPDAKLLMYKSAGHSVMIEKWDDIYPELVEFLSD